MLGQTPIRIWTLKLPDKLQPYGLYVNYVVHICDFGMWRVKWFGWIFQFMLKPSKFSRVNTCFFFSLLSTVFRVLHKDLPDCPEPVKVRFGQAFWNLKDQEKTVAWIRQTKSVLYNVDIQKITPFLLGASENVSRARLKKKIYNLYFTCPNGQVVCL